MNKIANHKDLVNKIHALRKEKALIRKQMELDIELAKSKMSKIQTGIEVVNYVTSVFANMKKDTFPVINNIRMNIAKFLKGLIHDYIEPEESEVISEPLNPTDSAKSEK